jgi:hypothetical protein
LILRTSAKILLHRLIDGVLQTGLGCQRRLAVLFLSRHHEVSRQRPIRDQLAVDVARQLGFRHAVPVARHAGGNTFESQIGKTHAGGRNRQHDGKAEHDLGAESQGWELER